jgi:hypothetical protein
VNIITLIFACDYDCDTRVYLEGGSKGRAFCTHRGRYGLVKSRSLGLMRKVTQFGDALYGLKEKCVKPTGEPYIISVKGGKDHSKEGFQASHGEIIDCRAALTDLPSRREV